jgi:hypothetical protein
MFPRTVVFMLFCAGIGYFLGRTRGMGLQGLFFGLGFGPLGWALILLWPRSWVQGPVPRQGYGAGASADHPASGTPGRPGSPGADSRRSDPASGDRRGEPSCPRCHRPVGREAGSCPHCGNVLVPIRYAVEDRKPAGPG